MLWVLIRSASLSTEALQMSTHNIFFSWRNKKNINTMYFWIEKDTLTRAIYNDPNKNCS